MLPEHAGSGSNKGRRDSSGDTHRGTPVTAEERLGVQEKVFTMLYNMDQAPIQDVYFHCCPSFHCCCSCAVHEKGFLGVVNQSRAQLLDEGPRLPLPAFRLLLPDTRPAADRESVSL